MPTWTWRTYQAASTGDRVIVGLELVSERRRRLRRETHVEERILSREFHEREIVAITGYRGLLDEVADHLRRRTFGSSVEVRAEPDGVRVQLIRRRLAPTTVEAEIVGEKRFTADEVADSAAYAEELRTRARRENDDLWKTLRDGEVRAEFSRSSVREAAREAADLAAILRAEGREPQD